MTKASNPFKPWTEHAGNEVTRIKGAARDVGKALGAAADKTFDVEYVKKGMQADREAKNAAANRKEMEEETKAAAKAEAMRLMDETNGGRGTGPLLPGEKFAKGGKIKPRGWGAARHK